MALRFDRIGQAMLAAGAALAVIGLIATLPRALRVRRRASALRSTVVSNREAIVTALATLIVLHGETEELLVPWRRAWRWARHPLVIASVQWYLRRRRRSA